MEKNAIPDGIRSFTCLKLEKTDFHGGLVVYEESRSSLSQLLFDGNIRVKLEDIYAGDGCAVVFSDKEGKELFRETVFLRSGICDVFGAKMIISEDGTLFTLYIRNMAEQWVTVYRAEWNFPG